MQKQTDKKSLFTPQFLLMCSSSFLFFSSFNMIIPELPNYLTSMGGADYKGWIIALFTLTAGISRPFSGKLTDTIGRMPIMIFGTLVSFVCGVLYIFTHTVALFLALRFLHGFSTGFKPTATSAYVADISPNHRRGEAMGLLSMFGGAGMAAGPAIGSWITLRFGLNPMFMASSISALMSILILMRMKETLVNPQSFKPHLLAINLHDLYYRKALVVAVIMMLTVTSFGMALTIIPDYTEHLGIKNKGLFFSLFTGSSLLVRIAGGRLSDLYGRPFVVIMAVVFLASALFILSFSSSPAMFYLGAIIFGFGVGTNAPTLFAWTIDLAEENYWGRALAMVYIALEIGIGAGSLLSAEVYDNKPENFSLAFMVTACLVLLALPFLVYTKFRNTVK